jgi:hypothetical protein
MPITAEAWNVTIVGFWNRAIYTPAGISRHLFRLPANTPVQVFIPIDLPAPYQVQHEGLTVTVGGDRLVVQPAQPNFARLTAALEIGRRALEHLPYTPLVAAGINFRYKSDGPVAVLEDVTASAWDERLSDQRLEIRERTVTRAVRHGNGRINVTVTQKEDLTFFLELNFDLQSDEVQQLLAWITIPEADLRREVERILYYSLGVQREEVTHGGQENDR